MGLSRNKVAVPEGAAGSPPFYGDMSKIPRLFMGRGVVSMGPAGRSDGVGVLAWNGRMGCGMDALLGSRTATLVGGVPVAHRVPVRVSSRGGSWWCGGGLRTG